MENRVKFHTIVQCEGPNIWATYAEVTKPGELEPIVIPLKNHRSFAGAKRYAQIIERGALYAFASVSSEAHENAYLKRLQGRMMRAHPDTQKPQEAL